MKCKQISVCNNDCCWHNISYKISPYTVFFLKQKAACPEVLYDEVVEVKERVVLVQDRSEIHTPSDSYMVTASTGEKVNSQK